MNRKSRIILVGKSASGKDHLRKLFESKGYKYGVSYTTRPPRINEVDGKDYNFLSKEKFTQLIEENFFKEFVIFNDWYYGTSNEQWYDKDDLYVMTPSGIGHLNEEDISTSFIIFIDIDIEIRRKRLMDRNDNSDTVDRRIETDEKDFDGFKTYTIRITNENF